MNSAPAAPGPTSRSEPRNSTPSPRRPRPHDAGGGRHGHQCGAAGATARAGRPTRGSSAVTTSAPRFHRGPAAAAVVAAGFGDPPSCGHQLGLVLAGRPRQPSGVDEVLMAPDIDRLLADVEVVGNLPGRLAGFDEIEDLAPELGRVTTGHRSLLECLEHHLSSKVTSPDAGHIRASTDPGAAQCARPRRAEASTSPSTSPASERPAPRPPPCSARTASWCSPTSPGSRSPSPTASTSASTSCRSTDTMVPSRSTWNSSSDWPRPDGSTSAPPQRPRPPGRSRGRRCPSGEEDRRPDPPHAHPLSRRGCGRLAPHGACDPVTAPQASEDRRHLSGSTLPTVERLDHACHDTITVLKTNPMVALAATVRHLSHDITVMSVVLNVVMLTGRSTRSRPKPLSPHPGSPAPPRPPRGCRHGTRPRKQPGRRSRRRRDERHQAPHRRRESGTQMPGTPDRWHHERRRRDEDRHSGPR